jgi:hypothetical protein
MPERFLEVPHIRQKSESDCLAAWEGYDYFFAVVKRQS